MCRFTSNMTCDNDGPLCPAKHRSCSPKLDANPCPFPSPATTPSRKQCDAVYRCVVRKTNFQDSLYSQGILRQRHGMFCEDRVVVCVGGSIGRFSLFDSHTLHRTNDPTCGATATTRFATLVIAQRSAIFEETMI